MKRLCMFWVVSLAFASTFGVIAGAQEIGIAAPQESSIVLTNAAARKGADLSGEWSYAVDPYRTTVYGFHGDLRRADRKEIDVGDLEARARKNPMAFTEFDMRLAPKATLPGSWVEHDPALRHYDERMWYERTFDASLKKGERAFLHFGAVNYIARVYLNGELLGVHEGGFTGFAFEATNNLRDGENRVTLAVDAQRAGDSVPPVVTDWDTYGGVTRPVRLVVTPSTFIDDAWVRLTRDGEIAASVRIDGQAAPGAPVRVRIPALDLEIPGVADAAGRWEGSITAPEALSLWTPDAPTLYDIVIESGEDTLRERIGFRTIEVRGEDILLNGEPIFLRGVCMHEEELGRSPSRRITEDAARELLATVKEGLNGNFVRLAHYPHSETTIRLADEMGILLWSEIPVYWDVDWNSERALDLSRRMLGESILRDRNRASVIFWSVANEAPVTDARNRFLRTLVDDVRALDDTRLVTAALHHELEVKGGVAEATIGDPLVDDLDVMAVNTYNGWYGPMMLDDVERIVWRSDHNKPLILSEFGAGALAGFRDPDNKRKFSEDYQAAYYRSTLKMSGNISFLRGMAPWLLKDFRSPRRQHPVFQQGWNRKGLISETGARKEAFEVLAEHYGELGSAVREAE